MSLTGWPSMKPWFLPALLVFFGACSGRDASDSTPAASVSDSSGIRIVSLAPLDQAAGSPTAAVELYSTRDNIELFQVLGASFLPDGGLAIANSGSFEVLYLDDAGELIRRFGREGDGPGEFGEVSSLGLTTDGVVWVYDRRRGRLTEIADPDGQVRTRSLSPPDNVTSLEPLLVDWDGPVLAIRGEHRMFRLKGETRDTVPLFLVRADGVTIDTIGHWPGLEKSFADLSRGALQLSIGFGKDLGRAANTASAVLGSTDSLALSFYDSGGLLTMKVRGGGPPVLVSDSAAAAWKRARTTNLPDIPGLVEALNDVRVSETYPAFDGLAVDELGRVWIGEYPKGDSLQTWWVVSRPGLVTSFRIPVGGSVLAARDSRIALLSRDELGEEYLVVYRIE